MVTMDEVKRYRELGFCVHPCCPHDHMCKSPGKIPYDPYEGKHLSSWQKHQQFSLSRWEEWLECEDVNIGFLCGSPSGLVGVDVDSQESLRAVIDTGVFDDREHAWQYRTGRGIRFLYRTQDPIKSAIVETPSGSFELLGDGRQSVLPPSIHPSGVMYEWVDGHSPKDAEAPDFGARLSSGVSSPSGTIDGEEEDWNETLDSPVAKGTRNNTMTRVVGHLLSPGSISKEEALFWLKLYNREYCKPPLGIDELRSIIASIARKEQAAGADGKREVQRIMAQYGVNRSQAEMMWRSMR